MRVIPRILRVVLGQLNVDIWQDVAEFSHLESARSLAWGFLNTKVKYTNYKAHRTDDGSSSLEDMILETRACVFDKETRIASIPNTLWQLKFKATSFVRRPRASGIFCLQGFRQRCDFTTSMSKQTSEGNILYSHCQTRSNTSDLSSRILLGDEGSTQRCRSSCNFVRPRGLAKRITTASQ